MPQLTQMSPPKPQRVRVVPGRQSPPEMHPVQQLPVRHVPPLQADPSGSLPLSTQVATLFAPPGHAVMPVLHWVGLELHAVPATQLMQAPPEQPFAQVVSAEV